MGQPNNYCKYYRPKDNFRQTPYPTMGQKHMR